MQLNYFVMADSWQRQILGRFYKLSQLITDYVSKYWPGRILTEIQFLDLCCILGRLG